MSVGAVRADRSLHGLAVGGYIVETREFRGVSLGLVRTKMSDMQGLAVAGYNHIRWEQRGLVIGIYNRARVLKGVQIGLLNYAGNNSPGLRWLPLINAHF
jgi:hypothetical protein